MDFRARASKPHAHIAVALEALVDQTLEAVAAFHERCPDEAGVVRRACGAWLCRLCPTPCGCSYAIA